MSPSDRRIHQPHVERNRDVLLATLDGRFSAAPTQARHILEIASGTGQHGWYFANRRPHWTWQPSEPNVERCHRADAWLEAEPLDNLLPAIPLDMLGAWQAPHQDYDLIFNANMIHIAPWACCEGLMQHAAEHLNDEGELILYGPYRIDGAHTAPSNAAFDARLRSEDPSWGVRDLEAVVACAETGKLRLTKRIAMPANNFCLVFSAS